MLVPVPQHCRPQRSGERCKFRAGAAPSGGTCVPPLLYDLDPSLNAVIHDRIDGGLLFGDDVREERHGLLFAAMFPRDPRTLAIGHNVFRSFPALEPHSASALVDAS